MMTVKQIKLLLSSLLIATGCNIFLEEPFVEAEPPNAVNNRDIENDVDKGRAMQWQQATVKYFNFEGGFYGLVTDDGQRYLPMGLAKQFEQDGAIVRIKGQVMKDVITTQQWGTPFKVSEVKLIKAGRKKVVDNH